MPILAPCEFDIFIPADEIIEYKVCIDSETHKYYLHYITKTEREYNSDELYTSKQDVIDLMMRLNIE